MTPACVHSEKCPDEEPLGVCSVQLCAEDSGPWTQCLQTLRSIGGHHACTTAGQTWASARTLRLTSYHYRRCSWSMLSLWLDQLVADNKKGEVYVHPLFSFFISLERGCTTIFKREKRQVCRSVYHGDFHISLHAKRLGQGQGYVWWYPTGPRVLHVWWRKTPSNLRLGSRLMSGLYSLDVLDSLMYVLKEKKSTCY